MRIGTNQRTPQEIQEELTPYHASKTKLAKHLGVNRISLSQWFKGSFASARMLEQANQYINEGRHLPGPRNAGRRAR